MKSFQFLLVALCASFSVALANPEEATEQLTRRALYEKRGGCTKSYKGTLICRIDSSLARLLTH